MLKILGYETTVLQIAAAVFGIGILVFIHELGHFLMAKKFKIKVEQFAFGFGPELFGFTYGETRYSLCAIPLGGMVKMPGEDIDSATGNEGEFWSQPWYKRFIIAFFGPLMNYVLAAFLFAFVIYFWGLSTPSPKSQIGDIMDNYPAKTAGMMTGDTIEKINGTVVKDWMSMSDVIHSNPGKTLKVEVLRSDKHVKLNITPVKDPVSGLGMIGIAPAIETQKVGFFQSIGFGAKMTVFQSVFTMKYLVMKLVRLEKPDLAGPIGVAQLLAKAAKLGVENLLYFLASISVALGLFNLFPIPLVDGGHMVLALIEGILRKPLNKKLVQVSNFVGLSVIVFIFIFATYSDLARLGLKFVK